MLFKPTFWLKSVLQIDEKFLTENGVKALVLDMDNTLSMHGNPAAEAGVDEWLGKMRAQGVKMRVVSNNTHKRGHSRRSRARIGQSGHRPPSKKWRGDLFFC